jgi:polysaccharide chain length determinant protein (PEP-CTERM system associated)
MLKYHWRGLFAAWAVAVLSAGVVMLIPKKYEASARIYANADSILKPLMADMTVQPDNNQRVAMLSRVVISRPNVQRLIETTGLDEGVKTKEERDRLIDDTIKVLELQHSGERGSNVYIVKFRDTQPARAKRVVEMLVSMFVDTNKGGRQTDTETAKAFLDEQASLYEKKLQDAESKVKQFKLRNFVGLETDGKDYIAQTNAVGDQLRMAQLQLREAENSRDAFQRRLNSEMVNDSAAPTAPPSDSGSLLEIDARIDATKRNLDSLLQKYTDNHPDVVGAQRAVRELEDQRRRVAAEYKRSGISMSPSLNSGPRASEQIKVSLAQAEANVASLRARVSEYSARYAQLRNLAKQMPEIEAELAQLNRDYDVNKKNYESLISRRESANIAGDMQSVAGVADFRLVDPPRVTPNAVSPNRLVLLAGSLLLSIVVALGTMFLSSELRPGIYDRAQLREATGLPILGVVSLVVSDQMKSENQKDLKKFAITAAGLFVSYSLFVGLMMFMTQVAA